MSKYGLGKHLLCKVHNVYKNFQSNICTHTIWMFCACNLFRIPDLAAQKFPGLCHFTQEKFSVGKLHKKTILKGQIYALQY